MVFDQNTHFGLDSDMAPLPRMTDSVEKRLVIFGEQ